MAEVKWDVPSIEELQDGGHKIKEVMKKDSMHAVIIHLDGDEFEKIGGNDGLEDFARKLASAATTIVQRDY